MGMGGRITDNNIMLKFNNMKKSFLVVLFIVFASLLNAQNANDVMEKVFANYEKNYFVNQMTFDLNSLWIRSVNDGDVDTLCIGNSKWQLPDIDKKQKSKRISSDFKKNELKGVYLDVLRLMYADYLKNKQTYFEDNSFELSSSNYGYHIVSFKKIDNKDENSFMEYILKINQDDYAVIEIESKYLKKDLRKPSMLIPIKYPYITDNNVLTYRKEKGKYVMDKFKGVTLKEKAFLAKSKQAETIKDEYLYVISNVSELKEKK